MTMGRKPYEPNAKDRGIVESMAGHGIPVADIARVVKIAEGTLRKYYGEELDTGQTKANSMVAQSLYQKAIGNGNGAVAACIFWLKVRAKWVEPRPWEEPVPGKKEQLQAAAVQAVIVTTLLPDPGQGFGRWLDAVVGCVLALAVATIAPSAPLRKPGILAAQLLQEMAATLRSAATALRASDAAAADQVLERARAGETQLKTLQDAADEGLAVVRHSPFRRRQLGAARAYAELIEPLDRASRNLRVLARRSVTAVWRGDTVPESYLRLLESNAGLAERMASELHEGKLPVAARKQLVAAARESSHLPLADSISAVVILAQARSMLVDLMELTGLDYADARELVPDMD